MRRECLVWGGFLFLFAVSGVWGQNVGVGTVSPHGSARLEISDTARGVLIPRLTTDQRNAIANPARSLLIYNVDCEQYEYFVPGSGWVPVEGGGTVGVPVVKPASEVGVRSFVARWDTVAGASAYIVEVFENCEETQPVSGSPYIVNHPQDSLVVQGLLCGSIYCYRVSAVTVCGIRGPSPPVMVHTGGLVLRCSGSPFVRLSNVPLPPREAHVAIVVHDKVYVGLGSRGLGWTTVYYNDWWRYDPCTGKWTQLQSFPGTPRGGAFIFAIDTSIYVGGGITTNGTLLQDVYRYDIPSNQWTQVASLPYAVDFGTGSGASDGTYGYVLGGGNQGNLLRYDPAMNTWTVISNYPGGGAAHPFLVYYQGKLYAGGANCDDQFYVYDLATNTWQALQNLPRPCRNCHAHVMNGKIYLANPNGGCTPCTKAIWVYDIATDTWNVAATYPGGANDDFFLGGVVGNVIFMGLGDNQCWAAGTYFQDWYMFCPSE